MNISNSLNITPPQRPNIFTKMDKDSDNKVTKDEFIAARPKNVSEADATSLFSKIDKEGSGSLSETQLKEGMEANKPQKSSSNSETLLNTLVLTALLQLNQIGQTESNESDDLFSKLDTNSDDKISKEEFIAGKPENVSEENASKLFNSIDTSGTGSIIKEQLEESFGYRINEGSVSSERPNGPPPSNGSPPSGRNEKESVSSSTEYDALDTNQDGTISASELMASLTQTAESSSYTTTKDILNNLVDAFKNYATTNQINLDNIALAKSSYASNLANSVSISA